MKINLLQLGTWLIGHFGALIALVQQTVHLVEQAPSETQAKREQAVNQILGQLTSTFTFIGGAAGVVRWVLGALVENYVAFLNLIHGHDWYGNVGASVTPQAIPSGAPPSDPRNIAQADEAARGNALTAANAQLRNTDVSGPTSAKTPARPGTSGPTE